MSNTNNRILSLTLIAALFGSCEKELDITEFKDDFGNYEAELRVEAVLDAVNPWNSMVRVDRTILITDTELYNGLDDDGDWNAETDDTGEDGVFADPDAFGGPIEADDGEGNGVPDVGEPHVDEYDEIISQLHDNTLTVELYDANQLLIEFAWYARADSFLHFFSTAGNIVFSDEDMRTDTIFYGGYRPTAVHGSIEYYHDYEFRLTSTTADIEISGTTTPLPPADFQEDEHTVDGDTLVINTEGTGRFKWHTERDATVTWVTVERIFSPDSIVQVVSHPAGPTGETDDGKWIGDDIMGLYFPGLYRWTVAVPSREYGAYIYSNLPMRDTQLSNLRDQDNRVVLGIAGSASPAIQYVRIPEPDSP